MLLQQGKNVTDQEFDAISDLLSTLQWELPAVQEYKNDLPQPALGQAPSKSDSATVAIMPAVPKANQPCTDSNWGHLNKMVAQT